MILFKIFLFCVVVLMVFVVFVVKELLFVGGKFSNFVVFEMCQVLLDNGLKVIFIFYGIMFKVMVWLVIYIGNIDDGGKIWLFDLSFEMFCQGMVNQFVQVLVMLVVSMGGQIDMLVGLDFSWLGMDVFSEFVDDVVVVIVDMVLNVNFDESDLVCIKVDCQCEFDVVKFCFLSKVIEVFYYKIYGNYFYGQLYLMQELLVFIMVEEIVVFVVINLVLNCSYLYVFGVFDEVVVLVVVKSVFGEW